MYNFYFYSEISKLLTIYEADNNELECLMDEQDEQQLLKNFIIDSGKIIITNILKKPKF